MNTQFSNFQEFLYMDGYALYVWSAWGIALIVAALLAISAYQREKFWNAEVNRLESQLAKKRQVPDENP